MSSYHFIIGFFVGFIIVILVSGVLNMNGFHFSSSNKDHPIFELENGTYIQCVECHKAFVSSEDKK